MSRIQTILFLPLLLSIVSCKSNKVEEPCDCVDFYQQSQQSNYPLLEFQPAYKANEIGSFFNDLVLDTNLFQLADIQITQEEFQQKFRANLGYNDRFQNSPQLGFVNASDTAAVMSIMNAAQEIHWLESHPIRFLWSQKAIELNDEEGRYFILYAAKTDESDSYTLTNLDIKSATLSEDSEMNDFSVLVEMTDKGSDLWSELTRKNISNFLAMISYNKVISAPMINGPITGGQTVISGGFVEKEARELTRYFGCSAMMNDKGIETFEKEIRGCREVNP